MICPDCEMEVEKLTKDGICTKCQARKINAAYIDRKKGTNRGYIPIKDLKGTIEYNRAMGKRLAELKRKNKNKDKIEEPIKKKSTTNIDKTTNSTTEEIKKSIQEDLESYYNKYGLKKIDNFIPLEIIFNWFYELCQKDNYTDTLKLKKQIYDNLIINALHELKNPINNPSFYATIGEKIALIQEQRTPIDNECDKYQAIQEVLDYLRNNQEFQDLLFKGKVQLNDIIERQKDPKYFTEAPSMQNYNYVEQPKGDFELRKLNSSSKIYARYYFKIKRVKYLYGNPNYEEFIYNSYILAYTEEEAKKKFMNYIKQSFPNLVYNSKDIEISNTPFSKECL